MTKPPICDPSPVPDGTSGTPPRSDHAPRKPADIDRRMGAHLKRLRERQGLTQQELADRCGVSFQQVQKYERGANRLSASRLFDFTRALGTDLAVFLAGVAGEPAQDPIDALTRRLGAAAGRLDQRTLTHLVEIAERLAVR